MHNRIKSLPLLFRGRSRGGYLFLVAMLMNLISCKLPTAADDPSIVSNLRFTPSAFDSFTKNTEVQYTLKNPVAVNISIIKKIHPVRNILSKHSQKTSTKPKERIGTLGLVIQRKVYSLRSVHT